jgi:16S rRNA (uracil1498-N3)-methyltransferase
VTSRVYINQPLSVGATITLPDDAARHLVQVLRMRLGDSFIAFNGQGGEYAATLSTISKREAQATIGELSAVDRESPLSITLAQCVSKGDRMDYTLQKAVELGVSNVVPLMSSRTVVKLDAERWAKKIEHWQGVIISACEQSGRTRVPQLAAPEDLDDWLRRNTSDSLKLVLAPGASKQLRQLDPNSRAITLLIGPEGGLSEAECTLAAKHEFIPLALGPRILRTETAGVAALAAIQAQWGDW